MPRVRVTALDLAPDESPTRPWEPDRWSPRHALAARLKGAGLKNNEIALAMGWTENKVAITVNDARAVPFIQEAAQNLADGVLDLNLRLKAHSEEALNTIVDQMRNAEREVIRQKAAFGILDRAGYTPIQKHTLVEAPRLPDDLGRRVAEAHAEVIETRRTIRFRAPAPSEVALPPGREVAADVPA